MAHTTSEFPQQPDVVSDDFGSVRGNDWLPESAPELPGVPDHLRVQTYHRFFHEATMWSPVQPVYNPNDDTGYFQHPRTIHIDLTDHNQPVMLVDPSQHAMIEPTGTINPSLLAASAGSHVQHQLSLRPHNELEYPPVYLASNNIPVTPLEPPAYNYVAAGHPSSPNNQLVNSLLQANAPRMAYILIDASSRMWIHACENTIGKDGPTNLLIDHIISDAAFHNLLKFPHLQETTASMITVTVHDLETTGQMCEKIVPVDPNNDDFMQAIKNELRLIPAGVSLHLWNCSRRLLQPCDSPGREREGIFPALPGLLLDPEEEKKLRWAFQANNEWGYGIFHEIIDDGNGLFRPGRWFRNTKFIKLLQEGMFDIPSPDWFGFIKVPADMNSSWSFLECPSPHHFAVAISWIVVTARIDFLKTRSVAKTRVSNTRLEEVKASIKFIEPWLSNFWYRTGGDPQARVERAEGIAFMMRYAPSPLQAVPAHLPQVIG